MNLSALIRNELRSAWFLLFVCWASCFAVAGALAYFYEDHTQVLADFMEGTP